MRSWIGGLLIGYASASWLGPRELTIKQLAVLYVIGVIMCVSHVMWLRGQRMRDVVWDIKQSRRGFTILELVVACSVVCILACMAGPLVLASQRAANTLHAHQRVRDVAGAVTAYNICENEVPVPSTCESLAPVIPGAGSLHASGYTYVMTGTAASYTFTATPDVSTQLAYYADNDGLVRCGTGSASGGSGVCQ